ncbi:hypothetical protein GW796_11495 [archaeon]|nr:hypothetical protein [archaeon]
MVKRNINKVKRTYRRASGFLGNSKMLNNPYFIGGVAGAIKNIINGKPAIDINNIQTRITQPNAKNPLLLLILGIVMNNTALKSIGAFDIIDPPITTDENIDEDLSDEEVDKLANEIIANTDDNIQEEKIYIHK